MRERPRFFQRPSLSSRFGIRFPSPESGQRRTLWVGIGTLARERRRRAGRGPGPLLRLVSGPASPSGGGSKPNGGVRTVGSLGPPESTSRRWREGLAGPQDALVVAWGVGSALNEEVVAIGIRAQVTAGHLRGLEPAPRGVKRCQVSSATSAGPGAGGGPSLELLNSRCILWA